MEAMENIKKEQVLATFLVSPMAFQLIRAVCAYLLRVLCVVFALKDESMDEYFSAILVCLATRLAPCHKIIELYR